MSNKRKSQPASESTSALAPVVQEARTEAPTVPAPKQRVVVVDDKPTASLSHLEGIELLSKSLSATPQAPAKAPKAVDNAPESDDDDDASEAPIEQEDSETPENLTDPDAEEETQEVAEAVEDGTDVDDEDLEELSELTEEELSAHGKAKGWPPSYTKRVKKFTRKLREAQAKAEGAEVMREKLSQLENPKAQQDEAPAPAQPDKDDQKIGEQIKALNRNIAWAMKNPDGGTLQKPNGESVEADATAVANALDAWQAKLDELTEQRIALRIKREVGSIRAEMEAREQIKALEQRAIAAYPWFNDTKSPEWKAADKLVRENPKLKLLDNWPMIVGQLVTGKAAMATNGNGANGHTKPAATPARQPSRPSAAPLPASRRDSNGSAALSQALKSGERKDAEAAVLSLVERRTG